MANLKDYIVDQKQDIDTRYTKAEADVLTLGLQNSIDTNTMHTNSTHAPSDAEANVNADWSSSSGDSEILNKPALGIGEFIDSTVSISHDDSALENDDGTDNHNIGIGSGAGSFISSGAKNIAIGNGAGGNFSTGSYNVAVGTYAGLAQHAGSNNVYVGARTLGSGNHNTSGSVHIGFQAGYSETASNKLHIANNSTESLIEGDFSAKTLNINGDITTNGKPVVQSDDSETGASEILNIIKISQADYDALTPVATTFYAIVD